MTQCLHERLLEAKSLLNSRLPLLFTGDFYSFYKRELICVSEIAADLIEQKEIADFVLLANLKSLKMTVALTCSLLVLL